MERCGGGPKSKDFWPTIKPFLSQQNLPKDSNSIILKLNDSLISDQTKVCTYLNDFYINITRNIGSDNKTEIDGNHPSIKQVQTDKNFTFSHITSEAVQKQLQKST